MNKFPGFPFRKIKNSLHNHTVGLQRGYDPTTAPPTPPTPPTRKSSSPNHLVLVPKHIMAKRAEVMRYVSRDSMRWHQTSALDHVTSPYALYLWAEKMGGPEAVLRARMRDKYLDFQKEVDDDDN